MNYKIKKDYIFASIIMVVLLLLDIGSTLIGITYFGLSEANPFLANVDIVWFLPIGIVLTGLVLLLYGFGINFCEKHNKNPYNMLYTMWFINGVRIWVVVGNIGLILK